MTAKGSTISSISAFLYTPHHFWFGKKLFINCLLSDGSNKVEAEVEIRKDDIVSVAMPQLFISFSFFFIHLSANQAVEKQVTKRHLYGNFSPKSKFDE